MKKISVLIILILATLIISCNDTFNSGIDSNNPSNPDGLSTSNERIVYVSTISGNKELWQMNTDEYKSLYEKISFNFEV